MGAIGRMLSSVDDSSSWDPRSLLATCQDQESPGSGLGLLMAVVNTADDEAAQEAMTYLECKIYDTTRRK